METQDNYTSTNISLMSKIVISSMKVPQYQHGDNGKYTDTHTKNMSTNNV